ncbi:MAG: hypothetical protein OEV06_01160 [Anaerolineae bacterium]|nr:hypothetical protein [Anaerolineae bacterium]
MIRKLSLSNPLKGEQMSRGFVWGMLIIAALAAFELFNFSTTDFAMTDLLGDLRFAGVRWATILAIAFCGIDFAGIARLFTPEKGEDEPAEVWYLFGAWVLAATMNAMLTWWGVSIAIANHATLGSAVLPRETLLSVVPVFVAVMVWLIRVLIIGTFSVAGERLFSQGNGPMPLRRKSNGMVRKPSRQRNRQPAPAASFRPAPKNMARPRQNRQPVSMASKGHNLHAFRE